MWSMIADWAAGSLAKWILSPFVDDQLTLSIWKAHDRGQDIMPATNSYSLQNTER